MGQHHRHHHDHQHGPSPHGAPGAEGRLLVGILLNLVISIAEVVGGIVSGSLSLLSDALHNFSDTASLGIAYGARRIARRRPTSAHTFGYRRAEILGAFANLITLVIIALFLVEEAIKHLLDPQPVGGGVMLVVAIIGLVANLVTALLLHRDAAEGLNMRSAFLHIVADAVSSVGVVVGAVLILLFDLTIVDPLLTILIAGYILYHSLVMLRQTVDILMEGAPPELDLDEVIDRMRAAEHVLGVHHVHVWRIDEHETVLEAHVLIDVAQLEEIEAIKSNVKRRLRSEFGIAHSTLEIEVVPCAEPADTNCYDVESVPAETHLPAADS